MKKTKQTKQMKLICLCLSLCLVMLPLFSGCAAKKTATLEELLTLGEQYLLEENYEEAVVAFEKAIKLDERCVAAYIGAADAYAGLGLTEKAAEILEKGFEKTGSEEISLRLSQMTDSESDDNANAGTSDKGDERRKVYADCEIVASGGVVPVELKAFYYSDYPPAEDNEYWTYYLEGLWPEGKVAYCFEDYAVKWAEDPEADLSWLGEVRDINTISSEPYTIEELIEGGRISEGPHISALGTCAGSEYPVTVIIGVDQAGKVVSILYVRVGDDIG